MHITNGEILVLESSLSLGNKPAGKSTDEAKDY
jgi:hypothetical protein